MAPRLHPILGIDWLTYYLLAYLLTYYVLTACLLTYLLPSFLPYLLPAYLLTYLLAYLLTYLFATCLLACLRTCLLACYLLIYLLAYLLTTCLLTRFACGVKTSTFYRAMTSGHCWAGPEASCLWRAWSYASQSTFVTQAISWAHTRSCTASTVCCSR